MWVTECNCCVRGIDLREGGAVHRSRGVRIKKQNKCHVFLYMQKTLLIKLIHIPLTMFFFVCIFGGILLPVL